MAQIGDKNVVVFDHSGPAAYVVSGNTGPASLGNDIVNASDLGMGGFDTIETDEMDPTGQLYAYVQLINAGNGNMVPTARLIWYSRVTATVGGQAQTANAEVVVNTNLSAIFLRMRAWGI
jgi:hypothetical protein